MENPEGEEHNGELKVTVRPYEIRTFRVTPKNKSTATPVRLRMTGVFSWQTDIKKRANSAKRKPVHRQGTVV